MIPWQRYDDEPEPELNLWDRVYPYIAFVLIALVGAAILEVIR